MPPLSLQCRVDPDLRAAAQAAADAAGLTLSEWLRALIQVAVGGERWEVESETTPGTAYTVVVTHDGSMQCDCQGYVHHGTCKHLSIVAASREPGQTAVLGVETPDDDYVARVEAAAADEPPQPVADVIHLDATVRRQAQVQRVNPRACVHPITRRNGARCGVCGDPVFGRGRR